MKKESLGTLLGLTQQELASILNVERTQISRYESGPFGKSPTASKKMLAMVHYMCGTAAETPAAVLAQQHDQKKQAVDKALLENDYQRKLVIGRIEKAEEKYQAKLKTLQVIDFLSQSEFTTTESETALLRSIAQKASKGLKSNGLDLLFRLKMKLELIELEKILLEAEARKIRLSAGMIGHQ